MWFLPLLVLGAIAVAAASRSPRESAPASRQLAAAPPPRSSARSLPPSTSSAPPGPISVLGEILRVGQMPPPTVVLCAIAEAQAIGRDDLASDIAQRVAPIVHRYQLSKMQHARGSCRARASHERGSCAAAWSPRGAADAASYHAPSDLPLETIVVAPTASSTQPADAPPAAPPEEPSAAPPVPAAPPSQDEILAMLHADPARFMAMATSAPRAQVVVYTSGERPPDEPPTPTGLPPDAVAQMQQDAGLPEAADQTLAMAPGSPLADVPDDAWRQFVALLSRESPQFASSRHVGQYRQRRERLSELGIDPQAIQGSAARQRMAIDADLVDAHRHAVAGGVIADHLGRSLTVPGRDAPEKLTLSGLLGVIQCAGLDGAVGWLERPNDRKRYPHTTQTFLNTNGVF